MYKRLLLILGLIMATLPAMTMQTYTLEAVLSFGTFDPLKGPPPTANGDIIFSCAGGGYFDGWVFLTPGSSNNYNVRTMIFLGGKKVTYNLYANPSYTEIWGNGQNGTYGYCLRNVPCNGSQNDLPIYGKIINGQTGAYVGKYIDSIEIYNQVDDCAVGGVGMM